jgi:hypothetical protein
MKPLVQILLVNLIGSFMMSLASAQTSITQLPYVINSPGVYVLAGPLTFSPGPQNPVFLPVPAIDVRADDVTIDLGGFTITYAGTAQVGIGIQSAANHRGLVVRNGQIVGGFNNGISILGIEDPSTQNCYNCVVEDIRCFGQTGCGINIAQTVNCRVSRCQVAHVTGRGIASQPGSGAVPMGNLIVNNLVSNTTFGGILIAGNSFADNNVLSSCGIGVDTNHSRYRNNTTINCQKWLQRFGRFDQSRRKQLIRLSDFSSSIFSKIFS